MHTGIQSKKPDLQGVREILAGTWAESLGIPKDDLDPEAGFFELGGFSLLAISLADKCGQALGIDFPPDSVLRFNTLNQLSEFAVSAYLNPSDAETGRTAGSGPGFIPNPRPEGEPFPLTDLQQAYWVGEKAGYEMRGPAYFFIEYSARELDLVLFNRAVNDLIARHEALRVVFLPDARQRILSHPPTYRAWYQDLSAMDEALVENRIAAKAEETKLRPPDLEEWPLFRFNIHKTRSGYRIQMLGRLIILDGKSGDLFARELSLLYAGRGEELARLDLNLPDYFHSLDEFKSTEAYSASFNYWKERLPGLPPAAALPPARTRPEGDLVFPMVRRTHILETSAWSRFQSIARKYGLTPTAAVCTAFCSILCKWSGASSFTLNMMFGNRARIHPQVDQLLGNFSNTLLLAYAEQAEFPFFEKARTLQARLFEDLAHGHVSGVSVLRELNSAFSTGRSPAMPIVFASGLGLTSGQTADGDGEFFLEKMGWRPVSGSLNTPQIAFDHQIGENLGALVINWDTRDAMFAPDLISDMFSAYTDLLARLCEPAPWESVMGPGLIPRQAQVRATANATTRAIDSARLLHQPFEYQAATCPEAIAILAKDRTLTYRELDLLGNSYGSGLRSLGFTEGGLVAILCEKGWEQIVAVIAVLKAGGAYVPINPSLPPARIREMLETSGAEFAFCEEERDLSGILASGRKSIPIKPISGIGYAETGPAPIGTRPGDLAYVIFTSGSTGRPKGVAIAHEAALNTLLDVNGRFQVNGSDRVLCISELNFDLSVFDIFGVLGAGGSLVIPDTEMSRNPIYLGNLVSKHAVTIWNSVPAFMELFLEMARIQKSISLASIRLVLLSGDWIPMALPGKLKALNPGIRLISLGGATEASVWSNWYQVESVPEEWSSIPYGFPLANQSFRVLDSNLEDCPDWVSGELHIGGAGLALGYYRDPEKTAASFITHPRSGERLYKTGDWGRYWNDGTLEFLGRRDSQVKIRGFRIELGEIEAALRKQPGIHETMVLAIGDPKTDRRLSAFYIPDPGGTATPNALRSGLEQILPPYMVPSEFHPLAAFPLTPNGKVDRKALEGTRSTGKGTLPVPPSLDWEKRIHSLWLELLDRDDFGIDDGFIESGGNSLMAVRLLLRLGAESGVEIPISSLHQLDTIRKLAAYVERGGRTPWSCLVPMVDGGSGAPIFLIHPIGGNILCYSALSKKLGRDRPVYAFQSNGLEPGAVPHRTIGEMASHYIRQLLRFASDSPILLAGWSLGGIIAYEMSVQLERMGKSARVVLIDSWGADPDRKAPVPTAEQVKTGFERDAGILGASEGGTHEGKSTEWTGAHRDRLLAVYDANLRALLTYVPGSSESPIYMLRATETQLTDFPLLKPVDINPDWSGRQSRVELASISGDHFGLLHGKNLDALAAKVLAGLSLSADSPDTVPIPKERIRKNSHGSYFDH